MTLDALPAISLPLIFPLPDADQRQPTGPVLRAVRKLSLPAQREQQQDPGTGHDTEEGHT